MCIYIYVYTYIHIHIFMYDVCMWYVSCDHMCMYIRMKAGNVNIDIIFMLVRFVVIVMQSRGMCT